MTISLIIVIMITKQKITSVWIVTIHQYVLTIAENAFDKFIFFKYGGNQSVLDFLDELVYYIVNICQYTTVIINDINLDCSRGGCRDHFDTLYLKLRTEGYSCLRRHFNNSNRNNHYDYGREYDRNDLVFPDEYIRNFWAYNPYESCSSAQIIIYKE